MEHRWRKEERVRTIRAPMGQTRQAIQTRYVCTCDRATRWHADERKARSERDAHALDGQRTLT